MTAQYPEALLALLGLGLLWWAHRRGPTREAAPLSALFLMRDRQKSEGRSAVELSAITLFLIRSVALVCCALALSGLSVSQSGGTLILSADALDDLSEYAAPVTVVRAGSIPSLVDDATRMTPVDSAPNWGAALAFGRKLAPDADVIRVPRRDSRQRVRGGASLDGQSVVVTVSSSEPPTMSIDGDIYPLERRGKEWRYRGMLPPGVASISTRGAEKSALCVPDARPLRVLDGDWPSSARAVLEIMPNVQWVTEEPADWRLGARPADTRWHPFGPSVTWVDWLSEPTRGVAPVWFERQLPVPDAVLHRWRPLNDPRHTILWADGLSAVDVGEGTQGRVRRFGFLPDDSDLPKTAAWPVLFFDAVEMDRSARSRCKEVQAGETVIVAANAAVTVTTPTGSQRIVKPRRGVAVIDRLDRAGAYILSLGSSRAFLAVRPIDQTREVTEPSELLTSAVPPDRSTLLFASAVAMLTVIVVGKFWSSVLLWLAVFVLLLATFFPVTLGGGPGPIVLAVDISGSMPREETEAHVKRLEAAFGDAVTERVEGAADRIFAGGQGTPLKRFGGETRYDSLVRTAAEVAGPDGVVVLVSDGLPKDGVVNSSTPLFTVPVLSDRPDFAVTGARAIRLGLSTFIRVNVRADRAAQATLKIGSLSTPVEFDQGGEQTVQAVLTGAEQDKLEVILSLDEDRLPQNNRRPVIVERQQVSMAAVVGPGERWARDAGFDTRIFTFAELTEYGGQLNSARALLLVDQPEELLDRTLLNRLETWVRNGGFLFLAGRERAFGRGGWQGTALEAMSPLRSVPRKSSEPIIGLALLVDRSGSIATEAGGMGLESIVRMASGMTRSLALSDFFAVYAFGGDVQTLLPPTRVGDIRDVGFPMPTTARGGTRLLPALREAEMGLKRLGVDRSVLAVFTDGRFADSDTIRGVLETPPVDAQVVGILGGEDVSEQPLLSLAKRTNGRLTNASREPVSVVMSSVMAATDGELVVDGGPVSERPSWQTRVGQNAPSVRSRVRVAEHPDARILASAGGDPLLAERRLGQGRVVALATDQWALNAEQWASLFAPALLPRDAGPSLTVKGQTLELQTDVRDRSPQGKVTLRTADGRVVERTWQSVSPGTSRIILPSEPSQVITVESQTDNGSIAREIVTPMDAELMETTPNLGALELQARVTGGSLMRDTSSTDQALAMRGQSGRWRSALFAACFGVMCLLLQSYRWARR